jgi:hypothetical protein
MSTNTHFKSLKESYDKVGNKTWLGSDFVQSNLDLSRNIFTDESLSLRKPIPKNFDVYALLSGISFSEEFCSKLVDIQRDISEIINEKLHYWVLPANLGVEYCVFKWPDQKWDKSLSQIILNELAMLQNSTFQFSIKGIQINQDGCVIARGYDEGGMIFKIREHFKTNCPFLPKKQSGWAHVPIGRILEPVGTKKFGDLRQLVKNLSNDFIVSEEINTVKFVHEKRWYMEEKSILSKFHLKIE